MVHKVEISDLNQEAYIIIRKLIPIRNTFDRTLFEHTCKK